MSDVVIEVLEAEVYNLTVDIDRSQGEADIHLQSYDSAISDRDKYAERLVAIEEHLRELLTP